MNLLMDLLNKKVYLKVSLGISFLLFLSIFLLLYFKRKFMKNI